MSDPTPIEAPQIPGDFKIVSATAIRNIRRNKKVILLRPKNAPSVSRRAAIIKDVSSMFPDSSGIIESEIVTITVERFAKTVYPYPGSKATGMNPVEDGLLRFVKKFT